MLEAWNDVRRAGVACVKGVTPEDCENDLEANLLDRVGRIKSGSCFASPVRRHSIPKDYGTRHAPH